jgi:predicted O-methyltransferase YrrM
MNVVSPKIQDYAEKFTSGESEVLRHLRDGKVLNVEANADENTIALHEFNRKIQPDARVCNVLFAVRDGLMIVRKEKT